MIKKLGLIAGAGCLPSIAANNAYEQGVDLQIYSFLHVDEIKQNFRSELRNFIKNISISDMSKMLQKIQQDNISDILFLGKIEKKDIFKDQLLDSETLKILKSLPNMNDSTIFVGVLKEFEKYGFNIISQKLFLTNLFLPEGVHSQKQPTKEEWDNIRYGMYYAKEISGLDIGQTIVVRDKSVVAVEAVEGTNECIKRAGSLIQRKNGIVCKVERKKQDNRFDIPTIGLETLQVMEESGCHILAIEKEKTLVVTPEEIKKEADKRGIILVSTTLV